jgi:competence protein ComEC
MKYKSTLLLVAVGVLFLLCAVVWSTLYASEARGKGYLTFAALDIGQGDALYIESPTGMQVLVDAGKGDGAILRALPEVMPWGDRTIDAAIETHPDADHMGGFVDVLKRYTVGVFIDPAINKHNVTIDALAKEETDEKIPHLVARKGMQFDLGGGALLTVLYPDLDVTNFENKTNEGCVVAKLTYASTSVLLTCDAPQSVEDHLIAVYGTTTLRSDVLKVGHHGSKYSSSNEFLDAVAPSVAVISVGADNTYGHPTPETLGRLEAHHIPVLRTDQEGTVVCKSDGVHFACH